MEPLQETAYTTLSWGTGCVILLVRNPQRSSLLVVASDFGHVSLLDWQGNWRKHARASVDSLGSDGAYLSIQCWKTTIEQSLIRLPMELNCHDTWVRLAGY